MLRNSSFQRIRIRTHNLLNLLSILENDECGHGSDTEFLSDVWDLVHVDLHEVGVGEFFGESAVVHILSAFDS